MVDSEPFMAPHGSIIWSIVTKARWDLDEKAWKASVIVIREYKMGPQTGITTKQKAQGATENLVSAALSDPHSDSGLFMSRQYSSIYLYKH